MSAVFTGNNAGGGQKVPGGLNIFWKVAYAGFWIGAGKFRIRRIAPPGQEGCLRHQENDAAATLKPETGWWLKIKKIVEVEPPPRPLHPAEASQYLLDVAATPPGEEGQLSLIAQLQHAFLHSIHRP